MALQRESQYKQEYKQNEFFHNEISPVCLDLSLETFSFFFFFEKLKCIKS